MVLDAVRPSESGELDAWVSQGTECVEAMLLVGSSGTEKAM